MSEELNFQDVKEQYQKLYEEYKDKLLNKLNIRFLDNMEKILPFELLENRAIIEGNVIGCLLSNNDLYEEYKDKLTEKDFITEEGRLFYRLGLEITKLGVKTIDKITIYTYLNEKESLKELFEEYGGLQTINDLKCINPDNIDAFLDTLLKYNSLNRLHLKGFNVLDNLNKFKNMTANEVFDWHDYMVSDTFLKISSTVKPVDLTSNNKEFIKKANKGIERGVDIDEPIFNYRLAGLHRGNILLHTAHSGVGKSSSIIPLYILPLIKKNLKVVLLINEQSENAWRSMLLPSVINNGYIDKNISWIPRNRIGAGGFTDEELYSLNLAAEWLDSHAGNLILYPLEDYSVSTLKKILKKMMRLDEETTFILDTWKPGDESSNNAHAIFTEESKELFSVVKPKDMGGLNIRFIATAQLSGTTIRQRYLDINALAKSKAIKEVCGQILMMRKIWQDEIDPDSKYYINPYKYNSQLKKKEYFQINSEKQYIIMFFDKNRYEKDGFQLLWEANLDFNYWKCIGYCTVKQDY